MDYFANSLFKTKTKIHSFVDFYRSCTIFEKIKENEFCRETYQLNKAG